MENYEGWDPHPSRKNIYIDQETGLLYKRVGKHFDAIPQKMTELQGLEDFRRATGVVAMISKSRGRVDPAADQISDESHT